ncbi:MAG TPA: amidohydrolase family protein [Streptosporangiaceae bacterium]|nr:amidohydrolase family protein [Streptosporangiaceae bacterium]
MELHVRGVFLPSREPAELWTDHGRISHRPVAGARTIASAGFVLPGLVDVHAHPGAPEPGRPLDEAMLRADLLAHRRAGVTAVRVAGSPGRLPGWVREDPDLPRVVSAGPWLSTPGLFFPGWGREVSEAELPEAATEEAVAADGWVKLRGDWVVDEETVAHPRLLPADVLAATVRRVHQAGGRVAIHAMHPVACCRAVEAGVDSLEHGLWLDHGLLPRMAAQGTALVPTYTPWAGQMAEIRALRSPAREWFLDGYGRLGPLTVAARAAGVPVLAGTDFRPHGTIAAEVRHLAGGGLPAGAAIGAACWTAREFLGLPGLDDGAPADFVIYGRDPAADLHVLDDPEHVVLGGRRVGGA